MDRRVLGSGAIVCSAMVLWSQPSAPESQVKDCDEGATACTATAARQAQPQPSILPPDINRAIASLPIQWSGAASDRVPDSMEGMYADLLKQAQAAASQNKLANALTTVSGIPNNSQHHQRAKQLQETWSQELLQRANARYQQGDANAALAMLNAIPPTSDRFDRAKELQERWDQHASLLDQAQSAKETGDWQTVLTAIESLKGTPLYDSLPVQQLLQQAIYRAYRSDQSLTQPSSSASDAASASPAALSAIPTDSTLPEAALPSLPDLPIDVDQAMEWARPISPPVASVPAPIQMPRPMARLSAEPTPTAPEAPALSGSIAPPEPAATTINKTRRIGHARQTMAENHSFDRKAIP